jgi:hypothetical protein
MHARLLCIAAVLSTSLAHAADDSITQVRAALTDGGDAARLAVTSGGKHAGVTLALGKGKPISLYQGEAAATIEAGHGRLLVAVSIDSAKRPFQIVMVDGGKVQKPIALARPSKRADYPFAVVATPTPDGFTVFFQEVETNNPNEAHTYMVELDKTGAVTAEAREVAVPWALAAAAWNGKGYHLGLFYTGGGDGVRLSMVSLTAQGQPEQHPDWASQPGLVSDVHLVASGGHIRAFYRAGVGDRLNETDVTTIGQWGQVRTKAKDLGALGESQAIAITAKGGATKIKAR